MYVVLCMHASTNFHHLTSFFLILWKIFWRSWVKEHQSLVFFSWSNIFKSSVLSTCFFIFLLEFVFLIFVFWIPGLPICQKISHWVISDFLIFRLFQIVKMTFSFCDTSLFIEAVFIVFAMNLFIAALLV